MSEKQKATAYKNQFFGKMYESLRIFVPKGRKAAIEQFASEQGKSINSLVNGLIREKMGLTEEEWKQKPGEGDPGA